MAKKSTSESFSAQFSPEFWDNSSRHAVFSSPSTAAFNRKKNREASSCLHPVDEAPDLSDPYSHLSLFLSDKIKQEIPANPTEEKAIQKWSTRLQEELLRKIAPEFQKRFPQYRLGAHALHKIFDKVQFYVKQLQGKTEAVGPDGKLNLPFFIKENLKQVLQHKALSLLQPYRIAHQIASKLSECVASLEGKKLKIDFLTKTVWSVQKHLLKSTPIGSFKAPYEDFDKVDNLIVKTILEITARHPHIGMNELESKTKESLQALHTLPDLSSTDKLTCSISAILAEKLYESSSFHILFFSEQKESLCRFIERHSILHRSARSAYCLPDLVRRITALYTLATHLPKDISQELFLEACRACILNLPQRPDLPQPLYAFLFAELRLLEETSSLSLEEVQANLWQSYKNTEKLPHFSEAQKDLLEIVIWKMWSTSEGFLDKLPYFTGQRIEEEIAGILIDDPNKSFAAIVRDTLDFFIKAKELTEDKKWDNAQNKIHLWCIQNDMLCRSVQLPLDTPLATLILQKWERKSSPLSHTSFISDTCQDFLKKYPHTSMYTSKLHSRAWTLYKYLWFTKFGTEGESSFDRFLHWHILFLQSGGLEEEGILKHLEEICKKCLPLIPFDRNHAASILTCLQERNYA